MCVVSFTWARLLWNTSCSEHHVKQAMPQLRPLWTWHPKPKPLQQALFCVPVWFSMHTNPLIFTSQLKHTLSQAFILSQANCGLIALIVRRARSVSVFVWSLFEKLYQHSKHNSQDWLSCFSYSLPIPSLQIRLTRRFSTAILYQTILCPHQTAVLCSNGQRVNLFLSSRFMKDTMQSIACVAWGCWKRHVKQAMPQLPPLWTWHPKPKPIPRTRVSNLLWARVDIFRVRFLTKAVQKTLTSLAFPAVAKTVLGIL